MRTRLKNNGSVFVVAIFVVAMLSTLVIGMLKINSSEIQLVQNQVYAAQALALAEAGLNAAMAEIRGDATWQTGFDSVSLDACTKFEGGWYTVDINDVDLTIVASVESWQGYTATVEAQITVSEESPHIIRIDNYRVNETSGGG